MNTPEVLGAIEIIKANNNLLKLIYKELNRINTPNKMMSLEEVAEYTKYSKESIRKRYKNEIGYSQRGKSLIFKRKDIDAWIDKNYTPGIK